ncbi:hypothetical protein EVAR_44334_1 [Eumeta japonica]|uniref:Uncharacterized protein n=1 Tax=Eumeta variegata TaxID=151549 RepID=A0A4C1XA43_EUMVA|nr:hypothetical protein EVAR_44334_1 [Eumeta japonica]
MRATTEWVDTTAYGLLQHQSGHRCINLTRVFGGYLDGSGSGPMEREIHIVLHHHRYKNGAGNAVGTLHHRMKSSQETTWDNGIRDTLCEEYTSQMNNDNSHVAAASGDLTTPEVGAHLRPQPPIKL